MVKYTMLNRRMNYRPYAELKAESEETDAEL